MDRLSFLFRATMIAVILLIFSTGTALGHPVANVALPDHYFYWPDTQVLFEEERELGEVGSLNHLSINEEEDSENVKIIEHIVVKGESISSIALDYGVSESTILNNNYIRNPDLIVLGQELKFPSVDGMIYVIKSGDTLGQIANVYQTTVEEILDVNDVIATQLSIGTTIILPNAKPVSTSSKAVSRSGSVVASLRNLQWPVNGVITSQYGWRKNPFDRSQTQFHRGLDIGASRGTTIKAATAGEVVLSGWQSGYGYTVIIKHGNDYTLYAHASSLTVRKGQWVSQGQEIAKVGATGNATGPHLHFEVRVQGNSSSKTVNPINYLTTK